MADLAHERRQRLERLFVEHASAVRAYAQRRMPPAIADDVVSEVFVVAWRRLDQVPPDPLPWLLGCARRIAANQRRSAHRRQALLERLGREPATQVEAPAIPDRAVAAALAALSDADREVLLLIAWEGLAPERAAAVIGCSSRAFAMRLHRARRRLAAALAVPGPRGSTAIKETVP